MSSDITYGEVRHVWLTEAQERMAVTETSLVQPFEPMLVLATPMAARKDAQGRLIDCFEAQVQLDVRSARNLHRIFAAWLSSVEDAW